MNNENYVITISRQFASMGRSIAQQTSQMLGIDFLDRDIVEATASRMGYPVSVISDEEENAKSTFFKRRFPLGSGMASIKDEIFAVQSSIIRDFAAKGPCIIVGRCADSVLRDYNNHLNVYVYAPYEARKKNCTEKLFMDEKTAVRSIQEIDTARENYQRKYCPEIKSIFDEKDIMIDSSAFGVEGTAKILVGIARKKFELD
ncbi:MAG: cytidylate kinase-like family protein [Lachnospira sp.]|nr:cytidylate kinase-like family protein [Lachnospira sp.]